LNTIDLSRSLFQKFSAMSQNDVNANRQQSNIRFGAGNSQYSSSSQAARDTLTEAFGWTVTDGGPAQ